MRLVPFEIIYLLASLVPLGAYAQVEPTSTQNSNDDNHASWPIYFLFIALPGVIIILVSFCILAYRDRRVKSKRRSDSARSTEGSQRGYPQEQSNVSVQGENVSNSATPPPFPPTYKKDIELATLADKSAEGGPEPPPYYAPPSGPPPPGSNPFPPAHMV